MSRFLSLLLVVFVAVASHANALYTNESLAGCSLNDYSASCTSNGYTGACVSISAGCCSTGTQTSNLCPGSSDIKCCTKSACSTPYGSGTCMQTSKCSVNGGSSISGYCIGESDLQCCVTGSSTTKSYGVDVSSAVGSSTASCLASSTFNSFIIPRGYKSTGSVDTNVCTTLNNAKTAGISRRDVYMFPNAASTTVSAASQLSTLVSYLKSTCSSAWSGFVWLDIEGTQYWTSSTSSNKAFLQSLVDACISTLGSSKCGVYSSYYQWSSLFGSTSYSYSKASALPLWYAHYDNDASFSDFTAFGGWSKPFIKQYAGDTTTCSFSVDMNVMIA